MTPEERARDAMESAEFIRGDRWTAITKQIREAILEEKAGTLEQLANLLVDQMPKEVATRILTVLRARSDK